MPTRAVAAGTVPPAPMRTIAHTFPRHRRSVGRARVVLRDQLAIWDVGGEVAYRALLLLSELATNAVRARTTNGRRIGVRFELAGTELRIEVSDSGEGKPELRQAGTDDETGRGLALVEALADDWGVSPRDGVGKTVWVLLVLSDGADGALS
ncbi:ATP-binding protein [Streptomyces ipomoeae]|uniref:ATP-binding protein n=1 Tax=Streptomyces ipomoeae TaxID=103232 RepID=UPI001FD0BA4A|nr:ATP-binding protein [Streptomyces ipomoeae]MDX2935685.1 ATP-binding protein [Streptomyces ipomoeae]